MGLAYVYLGYWVEGSPKMAYKARFMPQERLTGTGWTRVRGPETSGTCRVGLSPAFDRWQLSIHKYAQLLT